VAAGRKHGPGNRGRAARAARLAGWQTLTAVTPGTGINEYDVGLRPGTSSTQYVRALNSALGADYFATGPDSGQFYLIAYSLIALLTLMMAVVAGLGVFNTVLLGTRERVHDLGVFKAVGMAPQQTIAMVLCWVASPAYTGLPASFQAVYRPAELVLLALSALVIGAVGALLPASWAARSRTAVALRAE
jgi:putative ABC transport system permease protein